MTNLTKNQRLVLIAASQRDHLAVLPLPEEAAANGDKTIAALQARGLVREGKDRDLVISQSGLDAIGAEPTAYQQSILAALDEVPTKEKTPAFRPSKQGRRGKSPARKESKTAPKQEPRPAPAKNTKQSKLIAMLSRPSGATIDQLVTALGWQQHTVRGAIAGALKKKLGLTVTSEKSASGVRVYKID